MGPEWILPYPDGRTKGWMETVEIATNLLSLQGNGIGSLKRLLVLVLNDLELSEAKEKLVFVHIFFCFHTMFLMPNVKPRSCVNLLELDTKVPNPKL